MPQALREAGAVVHTMAEVYGERVGQGLPDEEWLADCGRNGWLVLMKDARIRYRPSELAAIEAFGVRAFCVTNGNLRAVDQAAWLTENLDRIMRAAELPGPFIYGVYAASVRRLWP